MPNDENKPLDRDQKEIRGVRERTHPKDESRTPRLRIRQDDLHEHSKTSFRCAIFESEPRGTVNESRISSAQSAQEHRGPYELAPVRAAQSRVQGASRLRLDHEPTALLVQQNLPPRDVRVA